MEITELEKEIRMNIYPSDWKTWKYWLHIFVISFAVLYVMDKGFGITNLFGEYMQGIIIFGIVIGLTDIAMHSILKMN